MDGEATLKVAIAGSRRLPGSTAPRLLIRFLGVLPDDAVILMRRGMELADPGPFEADVERLCHVLHFMVNWYMPAPTEKHPGRGSVFLRDIEMVEAADLVLLFFTPEEAVEGYSGTAHLLDKALDAGRPVYAYAVARDGQVTRVGEYDPDHLFADIAPSA